MNNLIDAVEFGISGKTVIKQVGKNHYAIVMSRKSRIIMADGRKLLEKFEQIKKVKSGAKLSLKTATPVCSKTISLLKNHNIYII